MASPLRLLRPRTEPRPAPGAAAATALAAARSVRERLKDGLGGPGSRAAARGLRRLLGAEGLALADLSGTPIWSGRLAEHANTAPLIDAVLRNEAPSGRAPLAALPLLANEELAGALVVHGDVPAQAAREAAALVSDALERARLEATAERAAQAEFRALRAEISPHFVYNALTVIASAARSDPDRAQDLLLDFADYTRYSLASHGDYTTVSDEFHAVETYLALQRAVLGERLHVLVRVAPEVLGVAVPYLVLQPLVENAIRHGIEPHSGTGTVQVCGEAEGNDCVISVEDDGRGMPPEAVRSVLAGNGDADSVGLANVDRRLRHVYGSWYGLVVETAEGAGTRVVVRVPRFQPGVLP